MYNILACCFFRLNNLNEALSCILKCQQIVEKLSPILTVRKASAHSMLALNICEQLIKNKDEISNIGIVFENIGELSMD